MSTDVSREQAGVETEVAGNDGRWRPPRSNAEWWPQRVDCRPLHVPSPLATPWGPEYDYRREVASLDVEALRRDLVELMTRSQEWWPADWGHYGPLFVRLAWHAAGTYRTFDGRGGSSRGLQRFAPQNSWPDNVNLDKARRLLWPIKKKYGRRLSWADLITFAGQCALEAMGVRTLGFGFGREDAWEPDEYTDWGTEASWLGSERYHGDRELERPYANVQMGLIYVNPEGPEGVPDPRAAARDIRETFSRMSMNDVETVALIVGGHTFGKCHGAVEARCVGPEPEAAPLEEQGLGWRNRCGAGSGPDTWTSGLEGAWTSHPTRWDTEYLDNLFGYEWELTTSPSGAHQWRPSGGAAAEAVPDAHLGSRRHPPMMLTTDLALKVDPSYAAIARRFQEHPEELEEEFAKAWYKLLHRDMGPVGRLLGPLVPEAQPWQDPVPPVDHELVDAADVAALKRQIVATGVSPARWVLTAWASASTYRCTDRRGGANGARVRLLPQSQWEVNEPAELARALQVLETLQREFNQAQSTSKRVSLADLVVLAGCAAVEEAARRAGYDVVVPFVPGRTDALQEQTPVETFAVLEPVSDGFRNYVGRVAEERLGHELVERAAGLSLTAPEVTVLVGGMRVIGATWGETRHGVLTERPGVLSTDFFVHLLDMDYEWRRRVSQPQLFEIRRRRGGEVRWTATAYDLLFGAHAQLRALAEVYAADDGGEKFVTDFVAAWDKVMSLDRVDLLS